MHRAMGCLLGHLDIAFVRGVSSEISFDTKKRVYRERLAAAGAPIREGRIVRLEDTDHEAGDRTH